MITINDRDTIELTVPARAEYVRIVRLVMAGITNSLGFNVEEIDDMKTAVGEAYNMFHPSEDHPLLVCTSVDARRIVVEITQQSNQAAVPRFFPMDSGMEKGIGLILLKHLMDEVEYKTGSTETHIRLVKNRHVAPTP